MRFLLVMIGEETERELSRYDIDVVYLPHTEGISTTLIRTMINK